MFKAKSFILVSLCFLFLTQTLFSQYIIQGTVTDNGAEYLGNGAEQVKGALVTITDQADTNRTFSSYTGEQGHYSIEITQTSVDDDPSMNPDAFRLLQNYPNPFNSTTVIGYELSKPAYIRIEIYNVLGQKVKTLLDEFKSSSSQVTWNGTNKMGRGMIAGLYIYSMKAEGKRENRKMLLIDGHQGRIPTSVVPSYEIDLMGKPALNKHLSDQYVLTVTGDNIAPYDQEGVEIAGNMTIDVTVTRIVTDIDGNVYRTVKIGNQWWMTENLKVTHYSNGNAIPNITNDTEWSNLSTGAYCNYDNVANNAATYSCLYNWYAVNDDRNIAPEGWHVPTDEELKKLEMHLGMSHSEADRMGENRGKDEGGKLKEIGTAHWNSPNAGATNESGFSALPSGSRQYSSGSFGMMGSDANFWSSTEGSSNRTWGRELYYGYSGIDRYSYDKQNGLSVRLVRD